MINVKFTAIVVRKDQGIYVAHAEEFPITAGPATTQRGAIKLLKEAVLSSFKAAAEAGTLSELLADAGYPATLISLHNITLEAYVYDSAEVSVQLSIPLVKLNRARRRQRAKGEEESYAIG